MLCFKEMGTYKVIQDIEAEDKFLGPLTLKQFIFAAIVAICVYLSFFTLTKGIWLLAIVVLPAELFFGFLAWPWGKDQPTETWLLARLRFMFKPRRRIWDQAGIKDLVTITAPKREERIYTDGLSQTEVRSRLKALANTIDSRGWAVKNVDVNLFNQPSYIANQFSDRLLSASELPQEVANYEITASDDMLDEINNPKAQQLNQMMVASAQTHRQDVLTRMQQPAPVPSSAQNNGTGNGPAADYWFMNQPVAPPAAGLATFGSKVVVPGTDPGQLTTSLPAPAQSTAAEEALLEKIHNQKQDNAPRYGHMRTIRPLSEQTSPSSQAPGQKPPAEPVNNTPAMTSSPTSSPAILNLANNDDLNVETIARQAKKAQDEPPADEVVISLH